MTIWNAAEWVKLLVQKRQSYASHSKQRARSGQHRRKVSYRPFVEELESRLAPSAIAGTIIRLAGSTEGDGGTATAAQVYMPDGVAVDTSGNLYIADALGMRVREVAAGTGVITTIAGTGVAGYSGDGGPANTALLDYPNSVAVDSSGNLYIADSYNNRIRKVAAGTGIITTVAGNGVQSYYGDGGPATAAALDYPFGVAVDAKGDIFIADTDNQRVREVAAGTGIITTVAGNGTGNYSGDGSAATATGVSYPNNLAIDALGDLFICQENDLREVTASTGIITTVAGTGISGYSGDDGPATLAMLASLDGVAVDANGNLFLADSANNRIREVASGTGIITTFAGNGTAGYSGDGGPAAASELNAPNEIAVDGNGNIFIADSSNNRIREVSAGTDVISTVAGNGTHGTGGYSGDGGPAIAAKLSDPTGVVMGPSGNIFIADTLNDVIREVSSATGVITTVARSSALNQPSGLALDQFGNLYIADPETNQVLKLAVGTGTLTTVAGTGVKGESGDGGPATAAQLVSPAGVAVDASGDLFIVDGSSVRKVAAGTGIITTVTNNAGNGIAVDANGDLFIAVTSINRVLEVAADTDIITTAASLTHPTSVAVDANGDLFVSDANNTVSMVAASTGIITTIAGDGIPGYNGDGGAATASTLNGPSGLAVDAAGNLLIADSTNAIVRKLILSGGPNPTSTTLTSSANPIVVGQSVTFTAAISGTYGAAAGVVTFKQGGTTLNTTVLAGGIATFTTNSLSITGSPQSVTAIYGGDSNFIGGTSTALSETVNQAGTAITVASLLNPAIFGQTVVFTASVTPNSPGSGSPTGMVTFKDGTSTIGTAPLTTSATFSTSALTVGTHSISALYGGDANFNISTSAVLLQTMVLTSVPTTTTLTSLANPSVFGQELQFTATVSGSGGTPTGTVSFLDGSTLLGTGPLVSGTAIFAINNLNVQSTPHTITAAYGADSNFSRSTSAILAQTVSAASTAGTVTSSLHPSVIGQVVTLTASISATSPGAGIPTGSVTFQDEGVTLAQSLLSGTYANWTTAVPSMPTVRWALAAEEGLDGRIYAIGGFGINNTLNTVEAYAPWTNSWTTVASMPTARGYLAAAVGMDGRIYAIGGTGVNGLPVSTVEAYSPAMNTWTTVARMPASLESLTAVTGGDGRIYAIGGSNGGSSVNTVEAYTPWTNSWTMVASMPTARSYPAAAEGSDGRIYAIGGLQDNTVVEAYTPATNTWTTVASLPVGIGIPAAAEGADGRIYVIGDNGPGPGDLVEAYSPVTNSWTTAASAPTARVYLAAVQGSDGRIYAIGGMSGTSVLGTVEAFASIGMATFSTDSLSVGTHSIEAVYSGDNNFNSSTSSTLVQTVNQPGPTMTALTSTANLSLLGQAVYYTATVSSGSVTPTGTVTFNDGSITLGTVMLSAPVWSTGVAGMPTARANLAAATGADGRIYAIGGTGTGGSYFNTVEAYTSGTNTWLTVAAMPTARGSLGAALGADDRIYAIGGQNASSAYLNTVEAYTLATNAWTTVASMPTARVGAAIVDGSDGRIYAIGGYDASSGYLNTVEAYTPATNRWTTVASMPTAREFLAAVDGSDGRIYAIGGTANNATVNTVEVYTPATNIWATVASLPNPGYNMAAAEGADGHIYAMSGYGGRGPLSAVEAYTPGTNTWATVASMSAPLQDQAAAEGPDGRIYAMGGSTGSSNVNTVEVLGYSGTATLGLGSLSVGTHTITAIYSGDSNFNGSTSANVLDTVVKASTTTMLVSFPNPSVTGQIVMFTATVASNAGPFTGTVTFLDNGTVLQSIPLSGNTAVFNAYDLGAGNQSIRAVYSGDSNFPGSTSAMLTQTVNTAGTGTTLTSSVATSNLGQSVRFSATVSLVGSGAGLPTGTVTFLDAGTPLGTSVVSNFANWNAITASMPIGSSDLAVVEGTDGRIYAIGGESSSGAALNTVQAYTPGTNTWTTLASMPTARYDLAAVLGADGRIYAVGGQSSGTILNTVEAYTLGTNTWTTVASLPAPRTDLAATEGADGRIYAIGGLTTGSTITNLVRAYTPGSNSWITVANMPTARYLLAAAAGADGRIYAIGGANAPNIVEAYAPATSTWTTVAKMPTGRYGLTAVAAVDGRIYAIGGYGNNQVLNKVEAYMPSTNSWSTSASMPTPRVYLGAAVGADARIYAIGGYGSPSSLSKVEALQVSALPTATYSTSSLMAGTNSITAIYGGDANFSPSTSGPLIQLVNDLQVTAFTPTTTGFQATFNDLLNASTLNLYDDAANDLGPPDVTVIGAATGPLKGSLVVDQVNGDSRITFLQTGQTGVGYIPPPTGILPNDTYTVTLRSATNGFVDSNGNLLDGNADGTPGDNYVTTFVVNNAPVTPVVSIPDFMRGPGQDVNVPNSPVDHTNNSVNGLPLRLVDSDPVNPLSVTSLTMTVAYNPALLTITGSSLSDIAPPGSSVSVDTSTAGLALVSFTSPTQPFIVDPASGYIFASLTATVPTTAGYGSKEILDLQNIRINGGTLTALGDDALHVVGFLGDTNADFVYTGMDSCNVARVAVGMQSGFAAWPLVDPVVIADINSSSDLTGIDSLRLEQQAVGMMRSEIPPLPAVTPIIAGPDPMVSIPAVANAKPQAAVEVPVNLDHSDGLDSVQLAISYDTSRLEVFSAEDVQRGRLLQDFDSFTVNLDKSAGIIRISATRFAGPITGLGSGSVALIGFHVRDNAPAGPAVINLMQNAGSMQTLLGGTDSQGHDFFFDLEPRPSNVAGDVLDGRIEVTASSPLPAAQVALAPIRSLSSSLLAVVGADPTVLASATSNLSDSSTSIASLQRSASDADGNATDVPRTDEFFQLVSDEGPESSLLWTRVDRGTFSVSLGKLEGEV